MKGRGLGKGGKQRVRGVCIQRPMLRLHTCTNELCFAAHVRQLRRQVPARFLCTVGIVTVGWADARGSSTWSREAAGCYV